MASNPTISEYIEKLQYWGGADISSAQPYLCPNAPGLKPIYKDKGCGFTTEVDARAWCDSDPMCKGYGQSIYGHIEATPNTPEFTTESKYWFVKVPRAPSPAPAPTPAPTPAPAPAPAVPIATTPKPTGCNIL